MSENEILLLALGLALLGYNIGILFLALPIPLASVKKWGPVLMKDSLYAAILVFSSNIILNLVPYFQSLLGSSWDVFDLWITERTGWLIGWKMAVSTLLAASSKITGGFLLYVIMEPFLKMVNYALTTIYSIFSLSILLRGFYARLIILGILLLSVPFRLTRKVGSYFIAFAIVFMVGLPFLPIFVSTLAYSDFVEPPSTGDVEFGEIQVTTITGRTICYPIIQGFNGENNLIFLYKGDRYGSIIAGFPDKGLPKNDTYRVYLDYLGSITPLEPFPVVPERDYVHKTSNMIESRVRLNLTSYILLDQPVCFSSVSRSYNVRIDSIGFTEKGGYMIVTSLQPGGYIEFRGASGITFELDIEPVENIRIANGTWSWYGISGEWTRVLLPVNTTVTINYSVLQRNDSGVIPRVREKTYLSMIGLSPWMDFTKMASNILMSWIVLPAVYLFILGTVSSGLAYVIGGSKEKVPIRLW